MQVTVQMWLVRLRLDSDLLTPKLLGLLMYSQLENRKADVGDPDEQGKAANWKIEPRRGRPRPIKDETENQKHDSQNCSKNAPYELPNDSQVWF